mgnify:CR=1 FL=1
MYDLDNLATDKKKGYIRALSHADINILMTDLIDEDKFFAHSNKYGSHLDMIAKTVMHSETGYSIIDPDGNFCSAFGVIPLEKADTALVWLLSCNNYKKNYNKINVDKRLLDLSNKVLDEINKKYKYILCHIEKNNYIAARRTKLMKFKKLQELDFVDEYIREV